MGTQPSFPSWHVKVSSNGSRRIFTKESCQLHNEWDRVRKQRLNCLKTVVMALPMTRGPDRVLARWPWSSLS